MKNHFLFVASSLFLSVIFSSLSIADEKNKTGKIDEMVIVSSRISQPIREIGTSVSVLNQEDIAVIGSNSLVDVMRTLPSVSVSNSGGAGKVTALRIRGEDNFRTMVLIDGMDVADPSTPQTSVQFDQIMSSGIGRVEILRGPQGMMFGADAGGVVNISTRKMDTGLSANVGAEAGRYGTQQLFSQVGGGNEVVDFYLSASDFQTDGFNASTNDLFPSDDDGYDNSTYHGRIGFNLGRDWRLEAVLRKTSGESQYDNFYAITDDVSSIYEQLNSLLKLSYDGNDFDHSLAIQRNTIERDNFTGTAFDYFYDGDINKINYLVDWEINDLFVLLFGADLKQESLESTYDGSSENDQLGYFVELQSTIAEQLYVNLGVRRDDNDDFNSHTSYRITAAKIIPYENFDLKLKSSASTGFRAPSLYEIASNNSPFAFFPATDTQLKEETSKGFDVGVELFSTQGIHFEVVYFDQDIEDKIYYDLRSYSGYLQDSGSSESKGFEVSGEWPLSHALMAKVNYTRNTTKEADGSARFRRPKNSWNVQLIGKFFDEKLLTNIHWRSSGDFAENAGSFFPPKNIDGYRIVNIGAHYYPIDVLDIYCRVENVTDRDYVEVPTYNTPGRSGYVGVSFSF